MLLRAIRYFRIRPALVFVFLTAFAVGVSCAAARADNAPTGTVTFALLQVTFSDQNDSVHVYSVDQLKQAATELNGFFSKLSYGKINLVIKPARVTMANTAAYYYGHCENDTSPVVEDRCTQFTQDAVTAEKAVDPHFFDGVSGVSTLIAQQGGGQFTWTPIDAGLGNSNTERSYLQESAPLVPPLAFGPSTAQWAGWAHEFGHELQYQAALTMSGKWSGHPAGYASGYDLMDSCYPCGISAYGLLGPPFVNDNRGAFPAWLDAAHVATVPIPSATPVGQSFVLPPLTPAVTNPVVQAVKVPIDSQRYYMVNGRSRAGADTEPHPSYPTTTGIYDQGVEIEYIDENSDPPATFCSGGGTGCVYKVTTSAYPYLLWHPGQTLTDVANKIQIRTLATVTGGYTVEVDRNVPAQTPNLFITPWLTPPMNTYETVDIWVDSSCNGYEDQGGALRYGRRSDGTVISNGDDPCANHANRIYATVHNIGGTASKATTVTFEATDPLGVGVTGNWHTVSSVALPVIAAGASASVFVAWTPTVTLTASQIASEHFNFHTCVRATVTTDTGDLVTTNKTAQENIDVFDAVQSIKPIAKLPKITRTIAIANPYGDRQGLDYDPHRLFTLRVSEQLPKGWSYSFNGGKSEVTLGPGGKMTLPVVVSPSTSPVGKFYRLRAEAYTYHWLTNPALSPADPKYKHFAVGSVGGVELDAHTVYAMKLTLKATASGVGVAVLTGALTPARPNVLLTIDAKGQLGTNETQLVRTDKTGKFNYVMKLLNRRAQAWTFQALWQGDMTYAGAVSPVVALTGA